MPLPQSRIFISYSHRGNGPTWKAALLRGLQVFETQHLLDVWEDGKIRVSSFWDDDIKQAMNDAHIAVVLLTREALESEYILNEEFPYLRDRQQNNKLTVFPVICEECDWRVHDWLRATQAPNGSSPIAPLKPEAQERIFRQLATDIAEQLRRAALAELPKGKPSETRLYLDKFPLTHSTGLREERLIGREQELALLDLAFAQPHAAIVSLVAWGGVGKSMLVQQWLRRLEFQGWFGARRVYAWSFYSQGTTEDRQASEDMFLAHALEWFGVQCEPTLSPWDKGRLLADAVSRERTLLILDGIEPLQYPPGPMGGQLRAPGVQNLLKQLARKAHAGKCEIPAALCLVTTREPLTDLNDLQRRPHAAWGSVLRVELGNLIPEAGAALLHHAGAKRAGAAEVKPDDTELLAASREVDGHALTLNLLGRFLARAHGGDIRRRDLVKFEEADRKEKGGTTFKMLSAFENWFARSGEIGARQLAVLRLLGLFDRPADAGCIAALRKPPVITGLTDPLFTMKMDASTSRVTVLPLPDEDWNTVTSFLADFGLVVIRTDADASEFLLDSHPLIREHLAKKRRENHSESWASAHYRIYEYLKGHAAHRPRTIEELQPLYQAVRHGCEAGICQEAYDEIFSDRIQQVSTFYGIAYSFSSQQLGAIGDDLAAYACFFSKPWIELRVELRPAAIQFYDLASTILNNTATLLMASGRIAEAIQPLRLATHGDLAPWQRVAKAQTVSNMSELELTLGNISQAISDAEASVRLADASSDWSHGMRRRAVLGDALHQAGRRQQALAFFRESELMMIENQPDYPLLYLLWGFKYCDLLLSEPERQSWVRHLLPNCNEGANDDPRDQAAGAIRAVDLRGRKMLDWRAPSDSLLDIAVDYLTVGRVGLYRAALSAESKSPRIDLRDVHAHLETSVQNLISSGRRHYVPIGLLSRAWLRILERDTAGAQVDLDEAWDIATRGPMRLHMADIHLYRARLFFREKIYPWKSPQDDLAAAEKLINDCGYHRRDEELDDAKRAILGS